MSDLAAVLVLALIAGLMIPVGGMLACYEHIQPRWLEDELSHSIIAFGGGAMLAAIAFVLVPEGSRLVPPFFRRFYLRCRTSSVFCGFAGD